MSIIWSLIGGFRGAIYIAIIVFIAGWAGVQYKKLGDAETAKTQAIAERDQAAIARDRAIQAARDNEQTISRLEEEKKTLNTALSNLESARVANRQTAVVRERVIRETAKVPENAAPAAPVIGNLISEIQADRQRRRGVTQ